MPHDIKHTLFKLQPISEIGFKIPVQSSESTKYRRHSTLRGPTQHDNACDTTTARVKHWPQWTHKIQLLYIKSSNKRPWDTFLVTTPPQIGTLFNRYPWAPEKFDSFLNILRPRYIYWGHHFADDILKCIFLNEKVYISLKILLKSATVLLIYWGFFGRTIWLAPVPVNSLRPSDAYMRK